MNNKSYSIYNILFKTFNISLIFYCGTAIRPVPTICLESRCHAPLVNHLQVLKIANKLYYFLIIIFVLTDDQISRKMKEFITLANRPKF